MNRSLEKLVIVIGAIVLLFSPALDLPFCFTNPAPLEIDSDFTFTSDIHEPIIVVSDNVVIDGNDYTLLGPGKSPEGTPAQSWTCGIIIEAKYGVTVKNLIIKDWDLGICLRSSRGCRLRSNSVNNCYFGFQLDDCSSNILTGNTAIQTDRGILLWSSSRNYIIGNTATANYFGFWLQDSSRNYLVANNGTNNERGFWLSGSTNNYLIGNTATNSLEDGFLLAGSNSNILIGNTAIGDDIIGRGFSLRNGANNNLLFGNTATHTPWQGFFLESSDSNVLSRNTAEACHQSYWLFDSSENLLSRNTAIDSVWRGYWLWNSSSNTLKNNTATYTFPYEDGSPIVDWDLIPTGFYLGPEIPDEDRIGSSENNIFAGNTVEDQWRGFVLQTGPHDNVLIENTASNNDIGFWLEDSPGNLIYHNNLIDNKAGAYDSSPANNDWHHPDLLEGNYWSDYLGTDDGSGTEKHAVTGDGIGDTSIPHPRSNFDYFPFVKKDGWI